MNHHAKSISALYRQGKPESITTPTFNLDSGMGVALLQAANRTMTVTSNELMITNFFFIFPPNFGLLFLAIPL
jgi:hypothetical protein